MERGTHILGTTKYITNMNQLCSNGININKYIIYILYICIYYEYDTSPTWSKLPERGSLKRNMMDDKPWNLIKLGGILFSAQSTLFSNDWNTPRSHSIVRHSISGTMALHPALHPWWPVLHLRLQIQTFLLDGIHHGSSPQRFFCMTPRRGVSKHMRHINNRWNRYD